MSTHEERSDHDSGFAAALESGASLSTGSFTVGGRRLLVRCVGEAHWSDLVRTFIPASPGPPDLTLELWDVDEVRVPLPAQGWPEGVELRGGVDGAALGPLPGGGFRYAGPAFDIVFDPAPARATGWVATAELPPWQRLRPWQDLLIPALAGFGLETVHSAMVARDGLGVVLPGVSGAGKSTVTVACLDAGFAFLGDDAIAIDLSQRPPVGHAVHAVVKLSAEGIAKAPALAARSERYDDPGPEERTLRLGGEGFSQTAASARIAAIAFPSRVPDARSELRPLTRSQCVAELLRHTLSAAHGRLAETFDALNTFADEVPGFVLEVGRDPAGIAATVERLLEPPAG